MLATEDALPAMSEAFAALERRAAAWFDGEGIAPGARTVRRTVDMRYAGQNYELPVVFPDDGSARGLLKELAARFERAHEQIYGYVAPEEPIQVVTFRLEAVGAVRRADIRAHPRATAPVATALAGERSVWLDETKAFVSCPVYDRERLAPGHRLAGPAIVEQMDATTLLLPGQAATVDAYLNLIVEV